MSKLLLAAVTLLPLVATVSAHAQGVQLPSAPNAEPVPGTVPPGGVGLLTRPQSAPARSAYRQGVRQARRRALTPPPGTTPLR